VTATTGFVGYALLTAAAVDALAIEAAEAGLVARTEPTDDIGDVDAFLLDLTSQWTAEEARSSVIVGDDTLYSLAVDLPASPAVVWDWLADPAKRIQWNKADRIDVDDPNVVGVGNVSHCVHGKLKLDEEIVDWKPYRYCTIRVGSPLERHLMTIHLEPDGSGSRVEFRFRPEGNSVRRAMFRVVFSRVMRREMTAGMVRLKDLVSSSVSQPA
jgi:uncharacterized protein YndB with AHSA1/START domain